MKGSLTCCERLSQSARAIKPHSALDKNPMLGHLLEGSLEYEGTTRRALTHLCIIRKNGQVTHTARQVACHLENNSRGKRSPILQKRRGLTLLYQHAGTLRSESEMERNTEVPASTRDESLLHSTKCRGVSRGPSKLHSIPDFSEAL